MGNIDVYKEQVNIQRALRGDDDAYVYLVQAYQGPVFNLCFRMLSDGFEAEEAAQEVFLRAYRSIKRYDEEKKFSTWLLSIASNYCIDLIRKRRFLKVSLGESEMGTYAVSGDPDPETIYIANEEQSEVQKLLSGLNPVDRACIVLFYWHDYTYDQIADMLSLSVSAVKSRLHRSKRLLANRIVDRPAIQFRGGRRDEPSVV